MRRKRPGLDLEDSLDVYPHVRLQRAVDIDRAHPMRLKARRQKLREDVARLRRGEHGIQGCRGCRAMIGMVYVSVAIEAHRRIPTEHHLGLEAADFARQVAPQAERRLQGAVGIVQQDYLLHPQDGRRSALFLLADARQLPGGHMRIIRAAVASRADDVADGAARPRPDGHGAGHGKLGIVGVSDNHHRPLGDGDIGHGGILRGLCLRGL